MFSVVLAFSMLGLGRILISDLVVTNLLMYSLPVMILLYLAVPFLHQRCFWMRLHIQVTVQPLYIVTDAECDSGMLF